MAVWRGDQICQCELHVPKFLLQCHNHIMSIATRGLPAWPQLHLPLPRHTAFSKAIVQALPYLVKFFFVGAMSKPVWYDVYVLSFFWQKCLVSEPARAGSEVSILKDQNQRIPRPPLHPWFGLSLGLEIGSNWATPAWGRQSPRERGAVRGTSRCGPANGGGQPAPAPDA